MSNTKQAELKDMLYSMVGKVMTDLREDIANAIAGDGSRDSYITREDGVRNLQKFINAEVTAVLDELEKHDYTTVQERRAIQSIKERYNA